MITAIIMNAIFGRQIAAAPRAGLRGRSGLY
jgi:hypothetical protein